MPLTHPSAAPPAGAWVPVAAKGCLAFRLLWAATIHVGTNFKAAPWHIARSSCNKVNMWYWQCQPDSTPGNPLAVGSAPTGDVMSMCAGHLKLVLHTGGQAMTQDQALYYCRQQHGANATLPGSSAAVLAAARALVEQAQVGAARCAGPCKPILHAWRGAPRAVTFSIKPARSPCLVHSWMD